MSLTFRVIGFDDPGSTVSLDFFHPCYVNITVGLNYELSCNKLGTLFKVTVNQMLALVEIGNATNCKLMVKCVFSTLARLAT